MKYVVDWGPRAETMLARIWLAATDRRAVTRAAARLDARLERAPLKLGESRRSSIHRVAFDPPLGLEFEVIEDDKKVIVQGDFVAE